MSTVFSAQFTSQFKVLLTAALIMVLFVCWAVGYYATPKYIRVGYAPIQPIQFSHKLHVGQLGLDCLYCHNHVDASSYANVPATSVCISCHGARYGNIKAQSAALVPLREAWESGRPIPWVRVHRVPDYAYFNHAVHVRRGVGCVACHGRIDRMEVVAHAQPLSMGWCLECHRNPVPHLRPADKVTAMDWSPADDPLFNEAGRTKFIDYLVNEVCIQPPEDCSACHR